MSEKFIKKYLKNSYKIKEQILTNQVKSINKAGHIILKAFLKGRKLICCGNGGSAADSQHFVTELVVRLSNKSKREKPFYAVSLTTNSSILTACGNDFGFDNIFSRQVQAIGKKGDVLFAISTSGNSRNVLNAVKMAKSSGIFTISLTGNTGGKLKKSSELDINVNSNYCPHIQEAHITIIHILCELIEREYLQTQKL